MFVRKLLEQFINDFRDGASLKSGRPSFSDKEERYLMTNYIYYSILKYKIHIKSKNYSICSNRKIKGERRQTNYFCDTCSRKPGLDIGDYFQRYDIIKYKP